MCKQYRQRCRDPSRYKFQPSSIARGYNRTAMKLVIKFAGALLESDAVVRELAAQVAALAKQGHEILIVHGGGRIFTGTLKRLGIESKFVNGLRVTDRETRDVAVMVFAGLLNKQLSAAISAAGQPAIGISAADAQVFRAEPLVHNEVAGGLGFVGYLTGMNTSLIESLWRTNLVPVAACLGIGPDNELYNINADHMAAACAEYLAADQLIYLTDVAGVLQGEKVISAIRSSSRMSAVLTSSIQPAKNISIFLAASPSTVSATRIPTSSKSSAANPQERSTSPISFTTNSKARSPKNSPKFPAWTAFSF